MHVTAAEDEKSQTLTRDITLFFRAGGLYRRSDEHHLLRLYEPQAVAQGLMDAGFEVRHLHAYGQTRLGPGWSGFQARKVG